VSEKSLLDSSVIYNAGQVLLKNVTDAFVAQTVAGSLLSSDSYPGLEAVK